MCSLRPALLRKLSTPPDVQPSNLRTRHLLSGLAPELCGVSRRELAQASLDKPRGSCIKHPRRHRRASSASHQTQISLALKHQVRCCKFFIFIPDAQ